MRQDLVTLVDERECGGQFHFVVTSMSDLLAKAMLVVSSRGEKGGKGKGGRRHFESQIFCNGSSKHLGNELYAHIRRAC